MATSDLIETPHGRCVILQLAAGEEAPLVGAEVAVAAELGPIRRRDFIAGRAALRSLLGEPLPIVSDDRGAPVLPAGWVGSISHKGDRAAALLAPAGSGFVGVDIEHAAPPRQPIERRILTASEQARFTSGRDVTRVFAIKEAIYKAIDPIVRRYVGFTEVEVDDAPSGACRVTVIDAGRLPVEIDAWWMERDGLWLATARARPR